VTVYRHVAGRVDDRVILQIATLDMLRQLGDILTVHHAGDLGLSYLSIPRLDADGTLKECGAMILTNEGVKARIREKLGSDPRIDEFDFSAIAE